MKTMRVVTLMVGAMMVVTTLVVTIVERTQRMLTIKEMTPIAVTMVGLTTGQERSSCGGGRCSRPLPTLGSTDTMEMATQTSRLNEAKNSCSLHWPVAEPV